VRGNYTITIIYKSGTDSGILEILHGINVIYTKDMYNTVNRYNQSITFQYNLLFNKTDDFRIRVNGKNDLSTGYNIYISKVDIFKGV